MVICAAVAGAWLLAAVSLFSASSASISTPLVFAAVDVEISFGDAGSNGLPASPGLWPRLGRPLLRTGDQIVPDIVLCVADFFGSMPRTLRLDRISPPKLV